MGLIETRPQDNENRAECKSLSIVIDVDSNDDNGRRQRHICLPPHATTRCTAAVSRRTVTLGDSSCEEGNITTLSYCRHGLKDGQ
ncbi:unnamed protein product [Soboliphyme baturini]|uniref:Uncharacterized protein n=1 Tax=Soboliphyme baturini TaxID=241478 RepID=A0A183IFC9_9BILA|nr:unnamed protein product [Soboliphyme baturini]